jgi:hypothetical protein
LVSTERNEVLYYGAYVSLVVMGDGLTIGSFSLLSFQVIAGILMACVTFSPRNHLPAKFN